MIEVAPSAIFEAVYESGVTGLAAGIRVRIDDNQNNTVLGPVGGVVELAVTGVYRANLTAPAAVGQFSIIWSRDGSFSADSVTVEDLVVTEALATIPALPPLTGAGPGPCSAWTSSEDVVECCSQANVGSDFGLLDGSVDVASQVLFEASGRIYAGLCQKTVRPCQTRTCGCNWQVLSRGHIVWSGDEWWCDEHTSCGCRGLSRVQLAGYPVRSIAQIKIDGAVVSPSTYRLDDDRYLARVRDPADPGTVLLWPACQSLDLDDTQAGTFSVNYVYGMDPPLVGQEAAKQLACQVFLQCSGQECLLPSGATRITRQGVQIERQVLRFDPQARAWRTGLTLVDAFLNSVNPAGLRRRPSIWSPASHLQYARPVGGG